MLQKTNREIRGINYQLQRIVASEQFYHTVLPAKRQQEIEVLEQSMMYFKVGVKGQITPMKMVVSFRPENSKKKQDLRVFMSTVSKEPSDTDNQKFVYNVTTLLTQ